MRKVMLFICCSLGSVLLLPALALAHVAVSPESALTGTYTTFTVNVPNEKTDQAVTNLKLALPAGLADAQPTVASGWQITIDKDSQDKPTAFTWSGSIPVGQRAEFSLRAQTPAKTATLQWKAYQTYADGSTVAWDQTPKADGKEVESESSGPYSVTTISDNTADTKPASGVSSTPLFISLAALLLAAYALLRRPRSN